MTTLRGRRGGLLRCGELRRAAPALRQRPSPGRLSQRVGRRGAPLHAHNNVALWRPRERNPTRFQKTLALHDWYLGSDDWDYPLGGIQMLGKSDDIQVRANAPRWSQGPHQLAVGDRRAPSVDFWLCTEDLPRPDNRVTLGLDGEIHLALDEKNNVEGLRRLRHKLDSMLDDLGMHGHHGLLDHSIYLHKGMPIGATAHQAGTVRFGTDPATSALDVNLPGPRAGQPLRRRHQLLRLDRGRESDPDHHRQRAPGGRPPPRPAPLRPRAQPGARGRCRLTICSRALGSWWCSPWPRSCLPGAAFRRSSYSSPSGSSPGSRPTTSIRTCCWATSTSRSCRSRWA